jgi:hypothetical protein
MCQFRFQVLEMKDTSPQEWLCAWSALYDGDDEEEYKKLIAEHKSFSAEHFERIGKWADGVTTENKWKPNVAMVAYCIWMQAAKELPKCPEENGVKDFLNDWSGRKYTDVFPNKVVEKHFGLARATKILHFLSGGRHPIFDLRVRTAVASLLNSRKLPYTVEYYSDSFLPLFKGLADCCKATDDPGKLRKLDRALFTYGARIAYILKLTHYRKIGVLEKTEITG